MNINSHALVNGIRAPRIPHVQQKTKIEDLTVPAAGGHYMVAIPVEPGEHWSLAPSVAWLHVVGKRSGVGPDVVMFNAQANPLPHTRQGNLQDGIRANSDETPGFGRTAVSQTYDPPKFRFVVRQDGKAPW